MFIIEIIILKHELWLPLNSKRYVFYLLVFYRIEPGSDTVYFNIDNNLTVIHCSVFLYTSR